MAVTDDARYYWNAAWTTTGLDTGTPTAAAPAWLQGAVPLDFDGNPGFDALIVKFWEPAWQQIVIAQAVALVQRGYTGVFLDDTAAYFAGGPADSIRLRATQMAEFIAAIGAAIRLVNPNAIVVINADPYLSTNVTLDSRGTAAAASYLQAVDAFVLENKTADALDYAVTVLANETRLILESDGSPAYSFAQSWQRGVLYTDPVSAYTTFGSTAYPVTSGDDTISGGGGPNTISGLAGNDVLFGNGGNDVLDGGAGINTLGGGDGDDRLIVATAGSGTNLQGGEGLDTVAISGIVTLGAVSELERIELSAGSHLMLTGAQFAGGFAATSTLAGIGTITIDMTAGTAFNASAMTLQIMSSITFTINGSAAADVIKTNANTVNTVNGGAGNDQIRGGLLTDTINGGDNNDKIIGYGGADVLTGGAGADQFRYLFASDSGTGANADRITDFLSGTDRLNFALLDADPVAAGRQALTYIDTAAFSADGTAQVRYGVSGSDLLVQVDLDGDGDADMEIVLQSANGQVLNSNDFML